MCVSLAYIMLFYAFTEHYFGFHTKQMTLWSLRKLSVPLSVQTEMIHSDLHHTPAQNIMIDNNHNNSWIMM